VPQVNELECTYNNSLKTCDVPRPIKLNITEIEVDLNLDDIYVDVPSIVAPGGYDDDKRWEIKEPIDDKNFFIIFSKCYHMS